MDPIECPECSIEFVKSDILNHLQEYHVGAQTPKELVRIHCGDCPLDLSLTEASIQLVIKHCSASGHNVDAVQLDWRQYLQDENERLFQLLKAGVRIEKGSTNYVRRKERKRKRNSTERFNPATALPYKTDRSEYAEGITLENYRGRDTHSNEPEKSESRNLVRGTGTYQGDSCGNEGLLEMIGLGEVVSEDNPETNNQFPDQEDEHDAISHSFSDVDVSPDNKEEEIRKNQPNSVSESNSSSAEFRCISPTTKMKISALHNQSECESLTTEVLSRTPPKIPEVSPIAGQVTCEDLPAAEIRFDALDTCLDSENEQRPENPYKENNLRKRIPAMVRKLENAHSKVKSRRRSSGLQKPRIEEHKYLPCKVCNYIPNKGWSQRRDMLWHVLAHNPDLDPFECPNCKMRHRQVHLIERHGRTKKQMALGCDGSYANVQTEEMVAKTREALHRNFPSVDWDSQLPVGTLMCQIKL